MELIVGQGFDHRAPHPTPPRLGSEAVGQEGLLQRLEFRAGLTPPRQSPHSRLRHTYDLLPWINEKTAGQRFKPFR